RSLLDLLDAENAVFTSRFQLASVTAVQVFAGYQLLATMGRLLATLGPAPIEVNRMTAAMPIAIPEADNSVRSG
ncbi:MAG: hypothetical protein R6W74_10930, partial [Nitrosomonas halophila]